MKYDNKYRHQELKSLVKGVFFTTQNSYKKIDDNTAIIYRGEGQALKDCSFRTNDRERYYNLFEVALTYKNCQFEYKGNRDNQREFCQATAMDNSVKYLIKRDVPLDYTFHSQEERYLFSRLVFRFITQLGSAMIKEVEKLVIQNGGDILTLHAQCRVKEFYVNLGYSEFGDVDYDEDCPHIWMKKTIIKE